MDTAAVHGGIHEDRYCPTCGYNVRHLPPDTHEPCPECGGRCDAKACGLVRTPWERAGRTLAIGMVVVFVLLVIGLLLPAVSRCGCGASPPLRQVANMMELGYAWATYVAHTGANPPHPGVLLEDNYIAPELLRRRVGTAPAGARIGAVPVDDFDPGNEDDLRALRAVIRAEGRATARHRLGDLWFVNWSDAPALVDERADFRAILAWTTDEDGRRYVLFADGNTEIVTAAEWSAVWALHEEARGELLGATAVIATTTTTARRAGRRRRTERRRQRRRTTNDQRGLIRGKSTSAHT